MRQIEEPITQRLTKMDVARAHVDTACTLFFYEASPVSIYTLASSAREILTAVGDKIGAPTTLHVIAERHGNNLKDIASEYANFFKHADRDPKAIVVFDEREADKALYLAAQDLGRVSSGMPISAQVYQAWSLALSYKNIGDVPFRQQMAIRRLIAFFPGIRSVSRQQQKQLGLQALQKAITDPGLIMEYRRDVGELEEYFEANLA